MSTPDAKDRESAERPPGRPPLQPASERPYDSKGPLIALFVVLGLAVAGWFLLQNLYSESKLQDCVASGRRNCGEQVDLPGANR